MAKKKKAKKKTPYVDEDKLEDACAKLIRKFFPTASKYEISETAQDVMLLIVREIF